MEVKTIVQDIKSNLSQKSCSQKDEVKVMQAMLNDKTYKVDIYSKEGKTGETYCPSEDARSIVSSVLTNTAKISKDEASVLAEDHEFSKGEAGSMVGISKEFMNTYLDTGRKISLGGREKSNISFIGKDVEASVSRYPKKVGVDENGKDIYENATKNVPAHKSVRAAAPCPVWVK